MADQAHFWSRAAQTYEQEFVDPFRPDVRNPLPAALEALAGPDKTAADLGCGIGPLLPYLASRYGQVHAVDFAPGMLERARDKGRGLANVTFHERNLADLGTLAGQIDVAVAVNSLVMPDLATLEASLRAVRSTLRPAGRFLGIVPAMDGVHYLTMLLLDRARARGLPAGAARRNAAHNAEHRYYDFAFGGFTYQGLEQHFWQPFEVEYRLRRAGFTEIRLEKVLLDWQQFPCETDLKAEMPPWDWFFEAG
jgi:SAM-dependent methyltransferase